MRKDLHLALSASRGTPGTSFTATASGAQACDPLRTAVAESSPDLLFEWPFGQQSKTTDAGSATAEFTVPQNAKPDTYQVTASCKGLGNTKASTAFTVLEKPVVALSPGQGMPGRTQVTATTKGFDACLAGGSTVSQTMSWQWDSQLLQTTTTGGDGSTVTFEIPADASPSSAHTVTVSCGNTSATAPFTVIAIPAPALKLGKGQGLPTSQVAATGTGFACGDDHVDLLWDGKASMTEGSSGTFTVTLTIPAAAPVGQHTVVAVCRNHTDITDSQSFTVTEDTAGVVAPAALALAPARGAPGDHVRVTGDRFSCSGSRAVLLTWDDERLTESSTDASGHVDTSIVVPADAPRSHIVRAACVAGPAAATAGFTVVAAGPGPATATTPPTTQSNGQRQKSGGNEAWVVVLLILGVAAVLAYRYARKPRPKPGARVYATVSPTAGPPLVTTRDTPTHDEVGHALRLRTRADAGTQTVSEVDDDNTAQ